VPPADQYPEARQTNRAPYQWEDAEVDDDSADLAQARVLSSALDEQIAHVSTLIEAAQRRRGSVQPTDGEKALRRDLYEAHRHLDRLHARFPETRQGGG
jgi:hypothetical protein